MVLVVPSDHFVENEWSLAVTLRDACELARKKPKRLVAVGATPRGPEQGYGWLVPDSANRRKRAVAEFVEKPTAEELPALLDRGAVIHTFLLAAHVNALLEIFNTHQPEVAETFRRFASVRSGRLSELYRELPAVDFSQDVLRNCAREIELMVAPPCGWVDVGMTERIVSCLERGHPCAQVFGRAPAAPLQLARAVQRLRPTIAVA